MKTTPLTFIAFSIGCAMSPKSPWTSGSPKGPIQVRIEAPEIVSSGNEIFFDLVLTNESDTSVTIYLQGLVNRTGESVFDVKVFDVGGGVVWRKNRGVDQPAAAANSGNPTLVDVTVGMAVARELRARETLRWSAHWNQVDTTGKVVPPGVYSVIGVVPLDTGDTLRTSPRKLLIR